MKKLLLVALSAFLISGVAMAQDSTKAKKDCDKKSCCKKVIKNLVVKREIKKNAITKKKKRKLIN